MQAPDGYSSGENLTRHQPNSVLHEDEQMKPPASANMLTTDQKLKMLKQAIETLADSVKVELKGLKQTT